MTIHQLLGLSPEEQMKLTDAQLLDYFKDVLPVTRADRNDGQAAKILTIKAKAAKPAKQVTNLDAMQLKLEEIKAELQRKIDQGKT